MIQITIRLVWSACMRLNCSVRISCAAHRCEVVRYLTGVTDSISIGLCRQWFDACDTYRYPECDELNSNMFKKIEGVECLQVFHSIRTEVFPFIGRFLICFALIPWAELRLFEMKWIGSIKSAHEWLPTFRRFCVGALLMGNRCSLTTWNILKNSSGNVF